MLQASWRLVALEEAEREGGRERVGEGEWERGRQGGEGGDNGRKERQVK